MKSKSILDRHKGRRKKRLRSRVKVSAPDLSNSGLEILDSSDDAWLRRRLKEISSQLKTQSARLLQEDQKSRNLQSTLDERDEEISRLQSLLKTIESNKLDKSRNEDKASDTSDLKNGESLSIKIEPAAAQSNTSNDFQSVENFAEANKIIKSENKEDQFITRTQSCQTEVVSLKESKLAVDQSFISQEFERAVVHRDLVIEDLNSTIKHQIDQILSLKVELSLCTTNLLRRGGVLHEPQVLGSDLSMNMPWNSVPHCIMVNPDIDPHQKKSEASYDGSLLQQKSELLTINDQGDEKVPVGHTVSTSNNSTLPVDLNDILSENKTRDINKYSLKNLVNPDKSILSHK